MRLWPLHLQHLDANGLVIIWRETLLAQVVICGKTRAHQLARVVPGAFGLGSILKGKGSP